MNRHLSQMDVVMDFRAILRSSQQGSTTNQDVASSLPLAAYIPRRASHLSHEPDNSYSSSKIRDRFRQSQRLVTNTVRSMAQCGGLFVKTNTESLS